jgi:type I restriction enzyme S subunit
MNLNDVCELIVDCPHSTAPDEGEGYPLIRTPNIGKGRLLLEDVHRVSKSVYDDRNKRAVPKENDLILAREAPVGNVALIKRGQEVCLGQRTVLIRPNPKKVLPEFLVYYLLSPQIQHIFTGSSNGTIVSHLNLAILRNMEISLPSISVQEEISKHFVAIDDKIDLNNALVENLENYIDVLYKRWFVDFNFPDDQGKPYKENGGQFVESYENERIPKGWKKVPLLEVVDWQGNTQPPKSTFVYEPQEGYVRFIQNRDYDTDNHLTYIPYTKKIKLRMYLIF